MPIVSILLSVLEVSGISANVHIVMSCLTL